MEEDIEPTEAEIKEEPSLQLFSYKHLSRPDLHAVVRSYTAQAKHRVANVPRNAQRTIALNKLRGSKDHACTALLWRQL